MKNFAKFLAVGVLLFACAIAKAEQPWKTEPFFGKGKEYSLNQFKGKDVLLMFYATWCGYCGEEMPHLATLKRLTDSRKLVIIPVSIDFETDSTIKQFFARKNANNLPIYTDMSGSFVRNFGVRTIPSFFLISKDGKLSGRFSSLSDIDPDFLSQFMNEKAN